MARIRTVIMGAADATSTTSPPRFRDDPTVEVVAFTATQIPGIDDRRYPADARRAALSRRHPDRARGQACRGHPHRGVTRSSSPTATCRTPTSCTRRRACSPRARTSGCSARRGPAALRASRHLHVRGAHRGGQERHHPAASGTRCSAGGSPGGRHPPPDALPATWRRWRSSATRASRTRRVRVTIEEREEYEHLIAMGRPCSPGWTTSDPACRRGRGRRHHLGRRQQRHAVHPSRPRDRRPRPAPGRSRAPLPPR
jgi:hypothetical protein